MGSRVEWVVGQSVDVRSVRWGFRCHRKGEVGVESGFIGYVDVGCLTLCLRSDVWHCDVCCWEGR